MAKWIKVHATYSGEPMWLNADLIWRMTDYKDSPRPQLPIYVPGKTMILKSDMTDDYCIVTETQEQIMELIDDATALANALKGDK